MPHKDIPNEKNIDDRLAKDVENILAGIYRDSGEWLQPLEYVQLDDIIEILCKEKKQDRVWKVALIVQGFPDTGTYNFFIEWLWYYSLEVDDYDCGHYCPDTLEEAQTLFDKKVAELSALQH